MDTDLTAIENIFKSLYEGQNLWRATCYGDFVDMVPVADTRDHYLGDECWCLPVKRDILQVEPRMMIGHRAMDGRVQ